MAEPETYNSGSAALLGRFRERADCPCAICKSPAGSATSSCDDLPAWRATLAAREEAEEEELDTEYEAAASEQAARELFRSPAAKDSLVHSQRGDRLDAKRSAGGWQQAKARMANAHPGVPGWRESSPIHPATPSWQQQ